MLDVDDRAVVEHQRTAGLRPDRDGEEQLGLTAVRALGGHRVEAVVEAERVPVGRHPQSAGGVERYVVRAGDRADLGLVEAAEVRIGFGGITTHEQQVPAESRAPVVVGDLDDLAVLVVVPRVGLVGRGPAGAAALGVVGQRHVHPAGGRAGLHVLGPVHLGGADPVARHTRVHGDLLGRHALDVRDGPAVGVDGHERDPGTGTVERAVGWKLSRAVDLGRGRVAGEAGHVEGALVEDPHVLGACGPGVTGDDAAAGDELVEVVEALVVAGIGHDGPVGGHVDARALMLEPAHRRVLHRRRVGIPRIDLDDVAEAVDLVGFLRQVEAIVEPLPQAA